MNVGASRTNGFLFADLRDFTRYAESHGDRAAAALLEIYRALVRTAVAEFGGAEIKTEGDSFYVVFPSASSAMQCGLAILDAAERASRDGIAIRVGIGIHAGETVETTEGYVGSAVNMAARVCSQARAGELLVTDTVRALTRTVIPVRFGDRRTRRLKGIPEPVVLYRVEPLPEGSTAGISTGTGPRIGRLPSPSGIPRFLRVLTLLAGLLIGGAASGYLLLAVQRPPAGTGSTLTPNSAAGRIAFTRGSDAVGLTVYSIGADGSALTLLRENQAGTPAWSPDGSEIALFVSDGNGSLPQNVHVMKANGTNLRQVVDADGGSGAWEVEPAWSPDGQRLAFTVYNTDANSEGLGRIWVVNANGTGLQRVSPDNVGTDDNHPTWSADGRRIAFARRNGQDSAIWVMNADGSNPKALTPEQGSRDQDPDWSPDGARIAFGRIDLGLTSADIYSINVEGTALTRVTDHPAWDMSPSWSPDGRQIAFVSQREFSFEIYRMTADGQNAVRLTVPEAGVQSSEPDWGP
jgi:Tol biopolymer transport system component/class 3 adenylate cyclase